MKIAFLSDIHSNLQALESVLAHVDTQSIDAIYCLGDVVGYGADPIACLELIRKRCAGVVAGNHDLAVATLKDIDHLPPQGREAALHNSEKLSQEDKDYLAALPLVIETGPCTLVHAAPEQPARHPGSGS